MSLYSDPIDTHGHTVADFLAQYGYGELALGDAVALDTSAAADDIFDTVDPHGFAEDQPIVFSSKTGGTGGPVVGTVYYVISANLAASTFQCAATPGGAAITWSASDITAGNVHALADPASDGAFAAAQGDMYLAQSAAEVEAQIG